MSPELLRLHLDYSAWASARLVAAAGELTGEERARDFGTADRSVLGTLVHIFAADRSWLARMRGAQADAFVTDADRSFDVLCRDWPVIQAGWREWAAGVTDPDALVVYQDLRGQRWEQPIWQPVLHAVNHATHHRGQVAGFLRSMGHKPPGLDLMLFYRELFG